MESLFGRPPSQCEYEGCETQTTGRVFDMLTICDEHALTVLTRIMNGMEKTNGS